MKKRIFTGSLIAIMIMVLMGFASIGFCASSGEWDKDIVLDGDDPSTIDDDLLIQFEAVDRLVKGYRRGCKIRYATAATLTVEQGEVVCSNAAGTIRKFRSNTSETTVTWANIDADSESDDTFFIYAVADADADTFTISISLSSSAPAGATYYAKIGRFVNDDGDISPRQVWSTDINNNYWVRPEDSDWEIGFSAYRSAAKTIAKETWADVICDTEDYDYGANYGTSSGRFTCDEAGRYLFTGGVKVNNAAANARVSAAFYLNGSAKKQIGNIYSTSAADDPQVAGSAILVLDVGDYVELYVYHESDATESLATSESSTYFQGIKIGR